MCKHFFWQTVHSFESFGELPTASKWQLVFNKTDDKLLNLYKKILILLSIPATSAFTERGLFCNEEQSVSESEKKKMNSLYSLISK